MDEHLKTFSPVCKQGFFCLQTRLLCIAHNACFECKQGFFLICIFYAWKLYMGKTEKICCCGIRFWYVFCSLVRVLCSVKM